MHIYIYTVYSLLFSKSRQSVTKFLIAKVSSRWIVSASRVARTTAKTPVANNMVFRTFTDIFPDADVDTWESCDGMTRSSFGGTRDGRGASKRRGTVATTVSLGALSLLTARPGSARARATLTSNLCWLGLRTGPSLSCGTARELDLQRVWRKSCL